MGKTAFTSASDGRFEVTTGLQGWQLGKKAGCERGKLRKNWNLPRHNRVHQYKQEISSVSSCLLFLMGILAKKLYPL